MTINIISIIHNKNMYNFLTNYKVLTTVASLVGVCAYLHYKKPTKKTIKKSKPIESDEAKYKKELKTILDSQNVFNPNGMNSVEWNKLVPLITQNVLSDAYNQSHHMEHLLYAITVENPSVVSRKEKTMWRINWKYQDYDPTHEFKKQVPFKVNSDLSAFRIWCLPSQIPEVTASVKHFVELHNGHFFERNSIMDNTGKVTDIVHYCFAYIPECGYITELQIGHPFAGYTFTGDSLRRDAKNREKDKLPYIPIPEEYQLNMWAKEFKLTEDSPPESFYGVMKKWILDSSYEAPNSNVKSDVLSWMSQFLKNQRPSDNLIEAIDYCTLIPHHRLEYNDVTDTIRFVPNDV